MVMFNPTPSPACSILKAGLDGRELTFWGAPEGTLKLAAFLFSDEDQCPLLV